MLNNKLEIYSNNFIIKLVVKIIFCSLLKQNFVNITIYNLDFS